MGEVGERVAKYPTVVGDMLMPQTEGRAQATIE